MVKSTSRKVFNICNIVLLSLLGIVFVVPCLLIVSASLTEEGQYLAHGYSLLPRGINFGNYRKLFSDNTILRSLWNSVVVTVVGTLLSVSVTTCAAYSLSKPNLVGRGFLMKILMFCMLFSGGLVPTYMLIISLGLKNTYWALWLPGLMAPWNVILIRSNFLTVPSSLEEAIKIDGGNNVTVFLHIAVPMCLPTIASITLFTAVGAWNGWSGFLLYFDSRHRNMYSITAILQEMLQENINPSGGSVGSGYSETFKMATVVVSTR
ncbi:MAG: carbohydrate ABC transporter permease [Candidatus Scatosoma sp.]